ncbi:MAG: sigma-70 family RNA polymerase sigma factor [Bacteroidota bacterium]
MFFKKRLNREENDAELIALYKESEDINILGDLYARYTHLVYGVCLKYLQDREESKDAVMQIFEKLVSSLKDHEVKNFKSWLHVVTKHHCLMALRSNKQVTTTIDENISNSFMETEAFLHHDEMDSVEQNLSSLEDCIKQLQNEQQTCIRLFYIEKKSYLEISTVTDFEVKKVKSYIQNGKRNLKLCMEKKMTIH